MNLLGWARVVLVAVVLVLVVLLYREHDLGVRREERIRQLDSLVKVDTLRADTARHQTDSVTAAATALAARTAHRDTIVRHRVDTITATVERIVHDTTSDSVKVVGLQDQAGQLVRIIQERQTDNDSLRLVIGRIEDVQARERSAFLQERSTMSRTIEELKKGQSRRVGLGVAFGYNPTRVDLKKPELLVGLVLRY